MTTDAGTDADADAVVDGTGPVAAAPRPLLRLPGLARRTGPALLVLFVVYVGLGLLTDAGGYLGTDTGGKVATLEAMDRAGRFDPDLGYWAAEDDLDGDLHALYYTDHLGDRYVNVTTLPLLVAAWPLYSVGGYHAAVAVVAAGAVAAAAAARALARRLGPGDGWDAYWVVGLASPVAVYALDLWEHAPGLALMAWGVVAVGDAVERPRPWWWPGLGGLAFGAAATMRTEALVYGAVIVGAGLVVLAVRRRPPAAVAGGALAALAGVAVGPVLHQLAEQALYGDAVRGARAGGALSGGFGELDTRVGEGLLTTFGVFPGADQGPPVVAGVVIAGLVLAAVVLAGRRDRRLAPLALALAGALTVVVAFGSGLGFVPGMLIASPVAVAGLLALGHGPARWLAAAVVAALPLVWAFQFVGGAGPQWGGRYQLTTGFVLAVLGVDVLARRARPVGRWVVALAACVTLAGVAWTVQRSHQVADAFDRLAAYDDQVVVSRSAFFLREGGPAVLDVPWLSVSTSDELRRAVDLVEARGGDELVLLTVGDEPPAEIRGWQADDVVDAIELFDDESIFLQTYRLEPGAEP